LLDNGTAVGEVRELRDPFRTRAAMWTDGKVQMMGNPRDAESTASGLNNTGTAVGYYVKEGGRRQSERSSGDSHAAMWKDARQIALPELSGLGECLDINARGVAVGWADASDGHKACRWMDGKLNTLPTPIGYSSEAYSINGHGTIVGECFKVGHDLFAYIWRDGTGEDLNKLIPADSKWQLSVAKHISDSGFIVGDGKYYKFPAHTWRAFLLTPIQN
jgi:uncharacterized membrane protein